jgi:hypothetical protein
MPPFAEAVCDQWEAILDKLEQGCAAVETELDWAIKLALYTHRAHRHGIPWESLLDWSHVLEKLTEVTAGRRRSQGRPVPLDLILANEGPAAEQMKDLAPFLHKRGLTADGGLERFVTLQQELFEIDMRFGQLGPRGIFTIMDRDPGDLSHHVPGVDNIEHALTNPPAVGRARLRGEHIKNLAGERTRYVSDWYGIWDREHGRHLDLSHPFTTTQEWKQLDIRGRNPPPRRSWLRRQGSLGERLEGLAELLRQQSSE